MLNEPFDSAGIQRYRLNRVTAQLAERDCAAVLLFDPVNIRYATGSRNMQVWTMHNFCRYCIVFQSGEVILYDLPSSSHLARDLDGVSEIRPSLTADYMMVGERSQEMAARWAAVIRDDLI